MKWNAIITKRQYENALLREAELGKTSGFHEDERALLRLLIRDYEQRNGVNMQHLSAVQQGNSYHPVYATDPASKI